MSTQYTVLGFEPTTKVSSHNQQTMASSYHGQTFFKNGSIPTSFCLFQFFANTKFSEKLQVSAGFELGLFRIIQVVGKHADHLTPITAQHSQTFPQLSLTSQIFNPSMTFQSFFALKQTKAKKVFYFFKQLTHNTQVTLESFYQQMKYKIYFEILSTKGSKQCDQMMK